MIKIHVLILAAILSSGCGLATKSWAMAGSCDAFKVVLSDPNSANAFPTIIAGGGAHAMAFAKPFDPDSGKIPPMISYSRRKSLWCLFSGDTSSGNIAFCYIGGSEESPEDTVKILEEMNKIVNPPKDK